MGVRGPKSAASLAVVRSLADARPAAPASLTEPQGDTWRAIVNRMPADWFRVETHGLLAAYCQHASAAVAMAGMIDSFQPEWWRDDDGLKRFDKLLAMRERETKAMASIATKLRMTPQARYTPHGAATAAKKPGGARAPWEIEGRG
jgi:hypothetical protein